MTFRLSHYRDDAQHIISLGAGRQSTAMTLMAAHGLIKPMPKAAIFADCGDEPVWVYNTLRRLQGYTLPFPIIVTKRGNLAEDLLDGDDMARIPFFVDQGGLGGRQCTRNFKIRPIRKAIRATLGLKGGLKEGSVVQWQGISCDEADRMKPSGVKYLVNRWPLIEQNLRVHDCEKWMADHDYPIPSSSACVYCPLISDRDRKRIRDDDPKGWDRALSVDRALRVPENVSRFRGKVYVHRSLKPLDQIDLDQVSLQGDLFSNECEAYCGV